LLRRHLPLYSIPHFSFTRTAFPVRSLMKGFGLIGADLNVRVCVVQNVVRERKSQYEVTGSCGAHSLPASLFEADRLHSGGGRVPDMSRSSRFPSLPRRERPAVPPRPLNLPW